MVGGPWGGSRWESVSVCEAVDMQTYNSRNIGSGIYKAMLSDIHGFVVSDIPGLEIYMSSQWTISSGNNQVGSGDPTKVLVNWCSKGNLNWSHAYT